MDAIDCIKTRKSIRKFTEDPVSRDLIMDVIATAQQSPSYKNSQPWEVAVVTGAKKEGLSKLMIDLLEEGREAAPDLAAPSSWPPAEDARIKALFQMRKEATGIDLGDPAIIKKSKKANFSFYGAPVAIYLYQDASLSEWSLFDIGLFAQSLMLAAHARGLASVPQAFVTDYSAEVREYLGLPAGKRLVLGLSVGVPDLDSSVNKLSTSRSEAEEITTWLE